MATVIGLHNVSYLPPVDRTICPPEGVTLGFGVSRRVPCEHWLYVAAFRSIVKVGATHQPARRIRNLARDWRGGGAVQAQCLWSLGVITRGEATRREYAVHAVLRQSFAYSKHRVEWYRGSADAIVEIVDRLLAPLQDDELVGLS